MLAGMFSGGVGIYVFYALQPYLLQLWGNPQAYGIAGLVAAIVAGAPIVGGLLTARIRAPVPAPHVGTADLPEPSSVAMLVADRTGPAILGGGCLRS